MASNRDYDSIGDYDPATESELRKLRRREKMAEMLAAQSLDPLQSQSAGRFVVPVSPWQGVAKLAQAYASNRSDKRNDAKYSEIVNALAEQQNIASNALIKGMSAKQYINPDTGTPEVRGVNGNMVPTEPAGGIEGGLAAMQGLPPSKYANEIRQTLALKLAEQDAEKQMAAYKSTLPEYGKNKPFPEDVQKQMIDIAAAKQQDRAPYFTPVYTPNGPYTFNNRAGDMYPTPMKGGQQAPAMPVAKPGMTPPGAGVAPPAQAPAGRFLRTQDDPGLQGQIAGAKKAAETTVDKELVGAPKAMSALTTFERKVQNVTGAIDKAEKLVGPLSTGYGAVLADLPNTDARALRNYLDTIKANLGFDELQAMRDSSPTGGALGQITDFENGLLQATQAALDPMQTDQLADNLKIIKDLYPQVLEERKAAYARTFGGSNIDAPGNKTGLTPPASRSRIINVEP